jgi:hypothetical protein
MYIVTIFKNFLFHFLLNLKNLCGCFIIMRTSDEEGGGGGKKRLH